MEITVLTHNDLDGCGALLLIKLIWGTQVTKYKFCNYDTIDKEVNALLDDDNLKAKTDQYLFITDICPSDKTLRKLHKQHTFTIQLIDHHKTKEQALKKYSWAYFDKDYSATLLTYQWLMSNDKFVMGSYLDKEALTFARACNDYDMWNLTGKDRKRGENLNLLLWFISKQNFVDMFYNDLRADESAFCKQILGYLEQNKKRYINKIIKDQLHHTEYCMCGFTGKTFKILIASEYVSDLGQAALADKDSEDLHYIVIVNPLNNTVSLRSRNNEDLDVSAICKLFHGGGHFHAGGFQLDMRKNIKNKVFKLLNAANG